MQDSYFLKTGTAGGTITILFANIHADDLLKTVVLAAVGAAVSLVVSFVLKKMFGKKK
ncbi:hypothetical protein WG954_05745 [Lacibacter sp. H375]|uniref:hypothetical protein n=1 Tax=Lacibacter sp. H375 TaxID=3133424 RepID=UPI0030BBEC39